MITYLLAVALGVVAAAAEEACSSTPPPSKIALENEKEGSPSTEWDINGAGDPTIQGFSTQMSLAAGETLHVKVKTDASLYRMDVYRMGYYGGTGARLVASVPYAGSAPQVQPECHFEADTLLVDCSNWEVSLVWAIPSDAVSGIYFGRLVRTDGKVSSWRADHSPVLGDPKFGRHGWNARMRPEGDASTHAYGVAGHGRRRNALREPRASHVYFVVRDDSGTSAILFQTMDTTWQAYNCWGTTNTYGVPCSDAALHAGSPAPKNATWRAYKASYNRPFATRAYRASNMPFNSEYPMVRWLERNGFDVSYWSGVDADRLGHARLAAGGAASAAASGHRLYLSVGHDEYWSGAQRAAVTAARDRGMHLAFFSGNEVYWRTRWEADPSGAGHRVLVCYKETQATAKIDPVRDEWTGTFRDGRAINPLGAQPENALTGTIYTVNAWRNDPITVPQRYGRLRFWRNTTVATLAPGGAAVFAQGILGHEWDEDVDNGHRPAGLMHLSETSIDNVQYIMDEGSTYDTGSGTHHLTLYRHASGALVFGAGTCQWAWGLDGHHDLVGGLDLQMGKNCYSLRVGVDPLRPAGERDVQQATLNLFSDMGIVPTTPQPDLRVHAASSDREPPAIAAMAVVRAAAAGDADADARLLLTGQVEDIGGGVVAAVEVSIGDGVWIPTLLDGPALSATWHVACAPPRVPCASITGVGSGGEAAPFMPARVQARAVDDSGNLSPPVTLTVVSEGAHG